MKALTLSILMLVSSSVALAQQQNQNILDKKNELCSPGYFQVGDDGKGQCVLPEKYLRSIKRERQQGRENKKRTDDPCYPGSFVVNENGRGQCSDSEQPQGNDVLLLNSL